MSNSILPLESASAALTVTLASLASSAAGVGRQSTLIDNTTNRYQRLFLYAKVKLGTSPSAGLVTVYLIRDDGAGNRDDGAGASDAGLTVLNAVPVLSLATKASPATGDVLQGSVLVEDPGPKWAVAVVQNTGVALDSTGGNHAITWVGEVPQIQ